MTRREPDWNLVKDILQAALARPAEERRPFAREAGGVDDTLVAEVESLLTALEHAGDFAERPALHRLAEESDVGDEPGQHRPLLGAGDRLGPYEILALLGAGGMGEVYKASDSRLHRVVALKVLTWRTERPDFRERFEREARTVAGLLHPNICVLHDIGADGSIDYLVMEYVEGETLAQRLKRGPLPIDDTMRCAICVANALAEVHRHGIVHRDVKPGNIMLTSEGAKLLDFGIAKLRMASALAADEGTNAGLPVAFSSVLGTPQYMAPEQLQGGIVDSRTDIFAFGAVLYEMIAGAQAFPGDTPLSVASAILEHEPAPISTIDSPRLESLDRIARRCLAKDPADRWQNADEIERALRAAWLHEPPNDADGRPPSVGGSRHEWLKVAWLLPVALLGVVFLRPQWIERLLPTSKPSNASPSLVLENARMLTGEERIEIDPVFSPDGRFLAYTAGVASGGEVVVRSLDGTGAVPLNKEAVFAFQPRWSPDGKQLLYLGEKGVYIAPVGGGQPRLVLPQVDHYVTRDIADGLRAVSAATWSPDGEALAIVDNTDKVLSIMSVATGDRRILARSEDTLHSCDWSRDGLWIACTSGNWLSVGPGLGYGNAAPSAVIAVRVADGHLREVTDRASSNQSPIWAADSHTLYFVSNRSGTFDIYAIAFASTAPRPPVRLTTGLGAYSIALSRDGRRLAYAAHSARANVWSIPIPSNGVVDITAAKPLTTGNQVVESMRVSRDGKWLVYDSNLAGNFEIYRVPVNGGSGERLTFAPSEEFAPDLSPDGRHLAYHSWRTKSRDVFVHPIAGGPVEQVTNTPSHEAYPIWSPDGRRLAFWDNADEDGVFRGIYITSRDSEGRWQQPRSLRVGPFKPSWSPDGRFLAYSIGGAIEVLSPDSGEHRVVYSRPNRVPGAEDVLVSDDGKTLYFKAHDDDLRAQIWSVPVTGGQPRLLVYFTDPLRRSNRTDLAVGAGRFFFTIDERRSNIWVADIAQQWSPSVRASPPDRLHVRTSRTAEPDPTGAHTERKCTLLDCREAASSRKMEQDTPKGRTGPLGRALDVTGLLRAWHAGDVPARDELLALVYEELKCQAAGYLQRERRDHTLQPTALVHETFLRLTRQRDVDWQNRAHFFGIAAHMMRRILVDYARERAAAKRPAADRRIPLQDHVASAPPPDLEVLMLDTALNELAAIDARQAQIVELRYFGGLSEQDVAALLSLSRATVTREWQSARAWLYRRLTTSPRSI